MQESSEKTELNRIRDEKGRMVFPPGVSGNPSGRPKGTFSLVEMIKHKLQEIPEGKDKTYAALFIDKLMRKSLDEGDTSIMRDIIDRVDGKPKQPLTGGSEDDQPIRFLIDSEIAEKNNIGV